MDGARSPEADGGLRGFEGERPAVASFGGQSSRASAWYWQNPAHHASLRAARVTPSLSQSGHVGLFCAGEAIALPAGLGELRAQR